MENVLTIIVVISVWLLFCVAMWRVHLSRQRNNISADSSLLIAYASQTGNTQAIANRCAEALHLSEMANVVPLNNLSLENLSAVDKILFIVSTYGDGEAPDNGNIFIRRIKNAIENTVKFNHLQFSVIALGDKSYPKFCAFGYQLHQSMLDIGAQANSEVITVDQYNEQTTSLASIAPHWLNIQEINESNTSANSEQYWQLTERLLLNPDCSDEKLFQLTFSSIGPTPSWQAGDLIDIQPHQPKAVVNQWLQAHQYDGDKLFTYNGHQQALSKWLAMRELPEQCTHSINELLDNLPYLTTRSYSIASISEQGYLQLIVRLIEKEENIFGLASGYLSNESSIGSILQGQIRSVSTHHSIDNTAPLILIGAGSGLAGLKAQIDARIYSKDNLNKQVGPTWLIFGERNSQPELPINKYLLTQNESNLAKLSCAYSQDIKPPKYVQHILANEETMLRQWLSEGAVIYVCGCLSGMGESVHNTLIELLGQEQLEELQLQQRYIRDVY